MGNVRAPGVARAWFSDVAAAAGVSVTTVSHALSGARTVNPQTRERILSAAEELGYAPGSGRERTAAQAHRRRGLRRRSTSATTPYAGHMIAGARRAGLSRTC